MSFRTDSSDMAEQQVQLTDLDTEQLQQVKKQLDEVGVFSRGRVALAVLLALLMASSSSRWRSVRPRSAEVIVIGAGASRAEASSHQT